MVNFVTYTVSIALDRSLSKRRIATSKGECSTVGLIEKILAHLNDKAASTRLS